MPDSTTDTTAALDAGWMSYDSVAETYERVAAPWFSALAGDLVAAAAVAPGDRLLDVGTGTGLALRMATSTTPRVWAVGVDPSTGMLSTFGRVDGAARVAAMAPGLPFANSSFDVAVANLSVSHVRDPAVGIADIARVLRPGGRFACTAWAPDEDDAPGMPRGDANRILTALRAEMGLDLTPPVQAAPWQEWLTDPENLRRLLTGAFDPVRLTLHRSRWTFTVEEFLAGWGGDARYRRHVVGPQRWADYIAAGSAAVRAHVGDHIDVVNAAWIAVAEVPASA